TLLAQQARRFGGRSGRHRLFVLRASLWPLSGQAQDRGHSECAHHASSVSGRSRGKGACVSSGSAPSTALIPACERFTPLPPPPSASTMRRAMRPDNPPAVTAV